jgi:uncharacterized protein YllA (UPF0747 family)
LKNVFAQYHVPYPVLLLRNSFLVTEKEWIEKISKLDFSMADFFLPENELLTRFVKRETANKVQLNGSFTQTEQLYEALKQQAAAVDATLTQHVDALKTKALYRLQELEKKMLRAEKRKFAEQQQQIQHIKQNLFPGNGLQERTESFLSFYARWGKDFIAQLYKHSLTLEQEFAVMIAE